MADEAITRSRFMRTTAAVGLGVLAHPTFTAKVFGANDRLVMGIIGPVAWVAASEKKLLAISRQLFADG